MEFTLIRGLLLWEELQGSTNHNIASSRSLYIGVEVRSSSVYYWGEQMGGAWVEGCNYCDAGRSWHS